VAVGFHKVSFVSCFNHDTGFNNFIQADAQGERTIKRGEAGVEKELCAIFPKTF
jgi:hypothetical protein